MKYLVLATLFFSVVPSVNAEIRLVSSGYVEVKPDIAIMKVYLPQSDVDLTKLNKKLDAKLKSFTDTVTKTEGVKTLKVLSKRIGIDDNSMYRETKDIPTILIGVYEVYVELKPESDAIANFFQSAIENGAEFTGPDSYYGSEGLITYCLKDCKDPMAKAHEKALHNARENAERIAKASGLTITKLTKVENVGSDDPCYNYSEYESEYPTRFTSANPKVVRVGAIHQFTFETK